MRPEQKRELAQAAGFACGLDDRHWTTTEYKTGAEYVAWLRGWREGQRRYKKGLARRPVIVEKCKGLSKLPGVSRL